MDGYDEIAAQEAQQRSQAPAQPRDDTYDVMAATEAENRRRTLKASLNVATQANPDKAGKVQSLSDKSGIPVPVVERNEDYVAQQQKARELYQAMQDSPVLARQMLDPSFAKIAQDDAPQLTTFEKVVRFPWKAVQSVASGLPALSGGLYGVAAAPFELSAQVSGQGDDSTAGRIGAFFRERSKGQAQFAERVADVPKDAGFLESAVSSGFQSLGQNLPTLITAMYTGNVAGALSIMSAATGGQSYTKARDKGLNPARSALYGATDAGFEYLTELLPVTKLIGDMKAGSSFVKTLMHNQISEQLGEQAATVLQDFNEWATLQPDAPFSKYLSERPAAALQTAIATAIGSGGQVAILHAAAAASGRDTIAEHGKLDAEALTQMLQLAGGSKLRERSPATFTQFVNEATAEGPVDAVYVNAAQFAQSAAEAGIDMAKVMPETAAAIQDAIDTDSDVRIPLGEFTAAIPGTTLEQSIIPHLRTSPDGPTQAESSNAEWVAETKAQTEKILAEHEFNTAWKQSAATVETELLTQLQQAKRFTPDVNKAYAGFMSAFYATQAHRLGITPEEMYVKYPLQIRAQNVAGVGTTIMGQTSPEFAKWFGDSKVVDAEGNPAVVYHGTDKNFRSFNLKKATQGVAWFTSDKSAIEAGEVGAQGKGKILELHARLENPASWEQYEKLGLGELKARGYDGAILNDADGSYVGFVFDAKQLKSATKNSGEFSTDDANIYKQPAQTGARGNINFGKDIKQQPTIMTLLANADLSTFLHESGHFYLEVLTDMAAQPDAPADVVLDLHKTLAWFGLNPQQWATMTLEDKRPYHEQWARGFEAYLFEGKAPAAELTGAFARFRAWMINVYKQLKALDVTLTDEVRGVMDRLVATNDEIIAAEEARNMAPLFATKPDGMSEADWKEYQALGIDATQDAVNQLQTRSLRDMQWSINARSRALSALQKDAAAKRRIVRMDARAEILSQPIYQAWRFLTRRLGPDDKLPSSEPKKSKSEGIDEFNDSLFTAIAKAGGLNRDAVVAEWGSDPKGKLSSGIFGKPVWRATGGRSIDDMATVLGQYGYFKLDEHGKIDLTDFEEKFGAELRGEPQYSDAHDYSRDQEIRPGDQIANPAGLAAGRFDVAGLLAIGLPQELIDSLENLRMTTRGEGLHPDIVAELFGFSSGDELARKLTETEPPASAIEGLTDQHMLERYGDLADPASISKAANKAVHNEVRGRFVATELNALTKAVNAREDTGRKNSAGAKVSTAIIPKAARDFAEAIVARKKIRDIKPSTYEAAEARAAKAAERAMLKNDIVSAAAQKRNQIVNLYAAKAAYNALTEVDGAVAYLKRVGESKTIDPEYRDQINALLERFDLRGVTNKSAARRESLAQWIEAQREKGFEPVIDEELVNDANRKPYREMPLEAFRGLVDAVRNIEHLGRLKHKLLTLQDQREFAAVVDELVTSIDDNAKRTIPVKIERNTWLDKMKDGFAEFFAMHRKFALMGRELDGHADNGAFWNLLVKPMNAAGDNESVMREQATVKLQELFEPILAAGKLREKTFIPAIDGSLSREGRLMVALNTGNDGNRQRLMDGDHWTEGQVQAVVDTLTKQEMDFVQSVWDFVGSYRAQIGEQQKRLTGITPEWVEARKVQTPHGEYAGGYLPAKYDTTRSTRSLADEAAAGIMDQWRAKRGIAKARDSFTKGRADKVVNRPLRKDFGVVFQHVTEVTHRLAWQDYLTDATRLLRASAVDNAIRDHYGPEVLKALRDTIEDVAAGEVGAQNAFEKSVNYLRTGATIAGLGWRVTTSLLQPIGLTQSMVRIGPKWVAMGMAEWLGDAAKFESTAARIFEKSPMMRLRAKTMQREISEIRNQVNGKASAIEASYFYLIQKMQLVADIPTWLGQYHKAVAGGAAEDNAVAQADQAVLDAQGGGQIKDLAGIQRGGPLLKLFTNFYSFFNTTYNLTSDAVGRTNFRDPLSVGKLSVDMLLLYSVPAVLGTLLKAALHSGDDEPYKNLIRQLISDQLTYLFGTMVGLREIAGGIQTAAGLPGDYSGPASVRLFAELAKLGKQAGQGEIDEALLKAADNVGGILLHYPAGQINATVDGIVTMAQGKTSNPGALLVGSNKK